jgi:hypothetical protein
VQFDGGVFINWMYEWYVLKRISGSVFGQTGPPGTHLLGIIVFFLPFALFVPNVFKSIFQSFKKRSGIYFLIGVWFISGWLVYEFSASKLPAYVIVAHVPFAVLLANVLVGLNDQLRFDSKFWKIANSVFVLLVLTSICLFPFFVDWAIDLRLPLLIICPIILLAHLFNIWKKNGFKLKYYLGIWFLFPLVSWSVIYPIVDDYKNTTKLMATDLCDKLQSEASVYIANPQGRPPSLFFYMESCFESVQEEYRMHELMEYYDSNEPVVLILRKDQADKFKDKYDDLDFLVYEASLSDRSKPTVYYILYNLQAER